MESFRGRQASVVGPRSRPAAADLAGRVGCGRRRKSVMGSPRTRGVGGGPYSQPHTAYCSVSAAATRWCNKHNVRPVGSNHVSLSCVKGFFL